MKPPRIILVPLLLGPALLACASPAASETITSKPGAPPLLPADEDTAIIQCEGPSAETAKLGKLCGFQGATYWQGDVADMSTAVGPEEGPFLVVLGFVPNRESVKDQAGGIKYDVRLVETPPVETSRWSDGTSLSGEMVTQTAQRNGCVVGTFVAGGTLHHGGVTITFGFRASAPC